MGKQKEEDMEGFQPAMMSFKSFMQTQDDSISDEDGIKKYGEYKLEFKRQQLNEFFVTHNEDKKEDKRDKEDSRDDDRDKKRKRTRSREEKERRRRRKKKKKKKKKTLKKKRKKR